MKNVKIRVASVVFTAFLTSSLLLGCNNGGITKSKEAFSTIKSETTVANMSGTIKELTAEKYNGRLAGSKENEKAAEYIAEHFKNIGLESPKGAENYMQYYTQDTMKMSKKPLMKVVDSSNNTIKEYEFLDDFTVFIGSFLKIKGQSTGEICYVDTLRDLKSTNSQLENKMVVIPNDVYLMVRGTDVFNDLFSNVKGLKGLICERDTNDPAQYEMGYFTNPVNMPRDSVFKEEGNFMVYVDSETCKGLKAAAEKKQSLYVEASYEVESKQLANVMGLIPGSDPKLKDEYIIISAHFDHIGNNMNGTYNPGAFDNASGTSIVMELARVMKAKNIKPKKSILFVAFNGEENGLYGSSNFAAVPPCKLSKAVNINLDMIGHKKDNPLTLYFNHETQLIKDLEAYAAELDIKVVEKNGDRSDHAPLESAGCQAVTLIEWEMKGGYHSPKDTYDVIDEKEVVKITEFLAYYISKSAFK